jgi:hypothetical protein
MGLGGMAQAGQIQQACMASGRTASSALCVCIQSVANQTLSRSEQRKVAKFFSDPHRAQEVRQSDRASDERLWTRYRQFGAAAQNYCS